MSGSNPRPSLATMSPMDMPAFQRAGRAVALVVDGNATSRRFVEMALGRIGDFAVEAAQDATSAREVLKVQRVDLILCDTELDDLSGLALFRSLREQQRLQTVPFIILSAERSSEAKVAAFKAGVDDYLVKPCDVAELVARAEALVARGRHAREQASARTFNLAGDLAIAPLANIARIVETGERTGVLSIVTEFAVGQLHFDAGRLVHAVSGNLVGSEALSSLLSEQTGHFEFIPGSRPVARTLDRSTTELLFEPRTVESTRPWGAEELISQQAPTTRPPPPEHEVFLEAVRQLDAMADSVTAPPQPLGRRSIVPALSPTATTAMQFERAMRDPYTLGELTIWTDDTLEKWTQKNVGIDRLHVHLVAEMASGVGALLAMAAAPTERWVIDCLSPGRKTLGLTFHLRSDKLIDVVLIDVMEPMTSGGSLMRAPSLMLFCPPRGSLLAMGTGARFELEMLIDTVNPRAILGIGDSTLSQLESYRRNRRAFAISEGDFGGAADLRALLVDGIRQWASTEEVRAGDVGR